MKSYSIVDYGARPDGPTNTQSIQAAIDACAVTGGVVEVPEGVYYTGTLRLRSHITLHLSKNAVLRGSNHLSDYRGCGYNHNEFGEVVSLLYALSETDITIEGEGVIDFNGDAFFDYAQPHSRTLDISGYTQEQKQQFDVRTEGRPNQMAFFYNCSQLHIHSLQFQNAACWGLVFSCCENIRILDVALNYSLRIPNDDGFHFCSCQNVLITGCNISAGDDCIAITGIDGWEKESRNFVISNCLMRSSSAGIRLGYWYSKVRGVQISNCTIYDSTRGLCIMSCGSGLVENVTVSGLHVSTRGLAGSWWGRGEAVFISALPHEEARYLAQPHDPNLRAVNVRNITLRDLVAESEMGLVIAGRAANVREIKLYNLDLTIVDQKNRALYPDVLDVRPSAEIRALPRDEMYWLYAEQVDGLLLSGYAVHDATCADLSVTRKLVGCQRVRLEPLWPEA